MLKKATLVNLLLLSLSVSCSLDYSRAQGVRELGEKIPELVVNEIQYNRIRNNTLSITFQASVIELFTSQKEALLYNVSFKEYQSSGQLNAQGFVEQTTLNTESENATLNGQISLYSVEQDAHLSAQNLRWIKATKILSSPEEALVQIDQKGGFQAQGSGFNADLGKNLFQFSKGIEGLYEQEIEPLQESETQEPSL